MDNFFLLMHVLVPCESSWAARATQSQALISFSFLTIITSSWAARATQSQALISFLTISIRDPIFFFFSHNHYYRPNFIASLGSFLFVVFTPYILTLYILSSGRFLCIFPS